ncbi:hypothetical protein [Lacticaseibacillus sp. GG6-2]
MRTKKRISTLVATVCAVIIVAALVFVGFHHRQNVMAQQHYEDRIHVKLADMSADFAKVKAQKNDAKRLAALKSLTKAYAAYRQGDEHDKQILAQYQADIAEEKQYFVHKNAAALKAATLDGKQLASASKKQLQANDHALAALLKVAKSERAVVYSDQQLKKLTVKIKALHKSYAARLKKADEPKADDKKADVKDTTATTATSASASSESATADADSGSDATTTAGTADTNGVTGSGTGNSGSTGSTGSAGYTGTIGSRSGYATSRYHRWTPSRSTSTGKVAGTTTTGAKASSTIGTDNGAESATGKTEVVKQATGTAVTSTGTGTTSGVDARDAGTTDSGK